MAGVRLAGRRGGRGAKDEIGLPCMFSVAICWEGRVRRRLHFDLAVCPAEAWQMGCSIVTEYS
jgi:hypothetical protein